MKKTSLFAVVSLAAVFAAGGAAAFSPAKHQKKDAKKFAVTADSMRPVRAKPGGAQTTAFSRFNSANSGKWTVRYNPRTALPEALTGGKTLKYSGVPDEIARRFFADNGEMLKIDGSQLELSFSKYARGVHHLQYKQTVRGIEVEFSYVRIHISDAGEVMGYQSKFEPVIAAGITPSVAELSARSAVSAETGAEINSKGRLVFYPDEKTGEVRLAWKIKARGKEFSAGVWNYYVDAQTGAVLFRYNEFRYACNTGGTINGTVYDVAPDQTAAAARPIADQYVWIGGSSSAAVTNASGVYCADKSGKISVSLKGPYFSVANARGMSGHFDNGSGVWQTASVSAYSPHPYANSQVYSSTITIPDTWSGLGYKFIKAIPHFSLFYAGAMDTDSNVLDDDELHIINSADGNTAGSYIGRRVNPFFGAAVENPVFLIELRTGESGVADGYVIDYANYLSLTNSPDTADNASGSITWSTANLTAPWNSALDEINVFYHLNGMRSYFNNGANKDAYGRMMADLNLHIPAMVHAHGNPDLETNGMANAFYDPYARNIFFGDGAQDVYGVQYSFGLDATVIRHEYVHFVNDRIYPIINFGEFGAVSEALADYFSLSSLSCANAVGCSPFYSDLGTYVNAGEGASRNLISPAKTMPSSWIGEVHDDSLILSQALWELRNSTPTNPNFLGYRSEGPRADSFIFNALFYFPDNFANFLDAMVSACGQLEGSACESSGWKAKINSAFSNHGISSSVSGDAFENNNGPESAADVSSTNTVVATIYPAGDTDYYSLPLAEGVFRAVLQLPPSGSVDGAYHAYSIYFFDDRRNFLGEAQPVVSNPIYNSQVCQNSGECLTESQFLTFDYNITSPGRYYLAVSAGPSDGGSNAQDSSASPYVLSFAYNQAGSAYAQVVDAKFDGDTFYFKVPYAKFAFLYSRVSTMTAQEMFFHHARLRDHSLVPVPNTNTNIQSDYLEEVSGTVVTSADSSGDIMCGNLRLKSGFNSRFPLAATVHLEIFGSNHLGKVASLGISGPINIAAAGNSVSAWNNIFNPREGKKASVRYSVGYAGSLSIKIYTIEGSLIKTLYDGPVSGGSGVVDWNGTNDSGAVVASGAYLINVKGPGIQKILKAVVVK